MASSSKTDKTDKLDITLPISIMKRVDKVRANVPREHFHKKSARAIFEEGE
ncbi:MAG: hypothetical protein WCF23_03370 [Candidatus Nitrosopolaris sp.]